MASYDKSKSTDYTLAVQAALRTLGADLGSAGVDGKWGSYTEAAYQQNKAAVDAIVTGMGMGAWSGALEPAQVDVPETKSFDQWLDIGSALYAAQYEAGKQAAQRQLEYAQKQVEDNRVQSAATLENAANARGFGRSSYTTDMLQRNENTAQTNQTALLNNFSDALMQLEANRNASAAQYASSMWQAQQDAVLQAQKFNAQMAQQTAIKQWEQAMAEREKLYAAASSGSSARRSSSGGSKTQSLPTVSSMILESSAKAARESAQKAKEQKQEENKRKDYNVLFGAGRF